ncbi:hypothetical protein CEXT_429481 [Caerostris extrusa]|uniref:Uncharacterized protein n=1 Tax=Caerostris extrusa TaxID=172846 RepID=A0AAV4T0Y9_CAEEX|nr:hypothetical protein CEXT_429481 [Caerostris extrusa]
MVSYPPRSMIPCHCSSKLNLEIIITARFMISMPYLPRIIRASDAKTRTGIVYHFAGFLIADNEPRFGKRGQVKVMIKWV